MQWGSAAVDQLTLVCCCAAVKGGAAVEEPVLQSKTVPECYGSPLPGVRTGDGTRKTEDETRRTKEGRGWRIEAKGECSRGTGAAGFDLTGGRKWHIYFSITD
jgi:hypothetical protein